MILFLYILYHIFIKKSNFDCAAPALIAAAIFFAAPRKLVKIGSPQLSSQLLSQAQLAAPIFVARRVAARSSLVPSHGRARHVPRRTLRRLVPVRHDTSPRRDAQVPLANARENVQDAQCTRCTITRGKNVQNK